MWFSDDPDIPQVLSARQYETYSGNYDIYLSWNLPSNIAPDDISHFTIYIDRTHIANETRSVNESLTVTVYRLCSCGSHNISITAVNRCGRSGRSVFIIVDVQLPMHQLTLGYHDIDNTSITTTGRDEYQTNTNEYQSMCTPVDTHTCTHVVVAKTYWGKVECTAINVLQLFCWQMTPLRLSSLAYPMISHTPLVAGN